MSERQRQLFAKGLVDLGNIGAGALIFGQFVSGQPFNIRVFVLGLTLTVASYLAALAFARG